MTQAEVLALRCHLARVASFATADGVTFETPTAKGPLDAELVTRTFEIGAYAYSTWEILTLRSKGVYFALNAGYDALEKFLDDPSKKALDRLGPTFLPVLGALATHRGISNTCATVDLPMPGLVPADPDILPQNAPIDPPTPVPQPLRGTPSKAFGGAMLGMLGVGAVTLGVTSRVRK